METTTVRVRRETRDRLAGLGERRGLSTADLLDELARRAEDDELLVSLNQDFASLREDPPAWEEHQAETAAWDQTSGDNASDG